MTGDMYIFISKLTVKLFSNPDLIPLSYYDHSIQKLDSSGKPIEIKRWKEVILGPGGLGKGWCIK